MSRLFSRKETYFTISILAFILTLACVEQCFYVYGWPVMRLNSAAVGWVLNMDQQPGSGLSIHIFIFFLFGILAAMPYGDSLVADRSCRTLPVLTIRTKGNTYFYSGALAAFTGSFLIFMSFFLLAQVLAVLVFPIQSTFHDYYNTYAWEDSLSRSYLFPAMFFQHPYLHNLIFALYDSLWAGIFALTSYAVSLFVRQRLVVLAIPQLILILGSLGAGGPEYKLGDYLYPKIFMEEANMAFFVLCPVVLLAFMLCLLFCGLHKRRELYI